LLIKHTGLIVRLFDDVISSAEVKEKQTINKVKENM